MGAPIHQTEFQSVEGFYEPERAGLFLSLEPALLTAIVFVGLALFLLGWWLGRRDRPLNDPSDSIHHIVAEAVTGAVSAPRDMVAARARALHAAIEAQLGDVLALSRGIAGPFEAIADALEDQPAEPPPPPTAPTARGADNVIINAARVTVQAAQFSQAEAALHEPPPPEPGPTPSPDESTRVARLRAAVHAFADHWADKPRRIAEIRAARRRLTRSSLPISGSGH